MKHVKREYVLICAAALLLSLLPGCGDGGKTSPPPKNGPAGVSSVLEARMAEADRLTGKEQAEPAAENADVPASESAETQTATAVETSEPVPAEESVPAAETQAATGVETSEPVPAEESVPAAEAETADVSLENVEVDLTPLSVTVLYPKVYEMTNVPQDYIGKTVKMTGELAVYDEENPQERVYACAVKDESGCCTAEIEFEPKETAALPEAGAVVTVVGVFERYYKKYKPHFTLKGAELR